MKDLISNTKQENFFISADGKVIKNVLQLKKALEGMKPEIFNLHVNSEKNDFYNWVKDIYEDKNLAEDIKKAKNAEKIIQLIEGRMADIDKEKQKEVGEIIDAIEKIKKEPIRKLKDMGKKEVKNTGPIKKPMKIEKEIKQQPEETTRNKIIKKLKGKFPSEKKKELNLKKLNLIPICKLDREDMINKIKKVYNNE
jgi:hypothetical protein